MWSVNVNGAWQPARGERQIINWLRQGHIGLQTLIHRPHWPTPVPLSDVPELSALMAADKRPQPKPQSTFTGAQWLVIVGALLLWIVSAASSSFGVGLGVALVVWTVHRHRKGQRSIIGIAFNRSSDHQQTMVLTVALGLLFATCGASGAYRAHQESAKKEQAATEASATVERQARQQAQQQAQQHTALVQQMPDKIKTWQSALSSAYQAADRAGLMDAARETATVQEQIETYTKMLGPPTLPELALLDGVAKVQAESFKARSDLADSIKEWTLT